MTDIVSRVRQAELAGLPPRLLEGARILGQLWRGQVALGVSFDPSFGDGDRGTLGLSSGHGARVLAVNPDSPAAKAGIQAGSILVEIGLGIPIMAGRLASVLQNFRPGDPGDLVFLEGKSKVHRRVVFGQKATIRCGEYWSGRACSHAQNDFCKAKTRWLALAREYAEADAALARILAKADDGDPAYTLYLMTVREFEACSVTITVKPPVGAPANLPETQFGPKGTLISVSWPSLYENEETWPWNKLQATRLWDLFNVETPGFRADAWEVVAGVIHRMGERS